MAWAAGKFGVTVSFIDGGSNVVSREYMMDDTVTDSTEAGVAALAIIADIDPLTDAALPQYRVFQVFYEDALTLPAGVQVENQASLTVQLDAVGNKKGNINVPAPVNTAFVGTTGPQNNIVNMASSLITNFLANFLSAGAFTTSDGEKITRGLDGKRVHKKSTRG